MNIASYALQCKHLYGKIDIKVTNKAVEQTSNDRKTIRISHWKQRNKRKARKLFIQYSFKFLTISVFPIHNLLFRLSLMVVTVGKIKRLLFKNTFFRWNEADIVKLVHVTHHESVASSNIILWTNYYVIVMTTDHLNACFKAVCCTV